MRVRWHCFPSVLSVCCRDSYLSSVLYDTSSWKWELAIVRTPRISPDCLIYILLCSFMFSATVVGCKEMLKPCFCSVTALLGWDMHPNSYLQNVKTGVSGIKLLQLCNFQAIFCRKLVLLWVECLTHLSAHSFRRNVSTLTCLTASKFTTTWALPSVTTAAACSGGWSSKDSNVKVWRKREGSWDLPLLVQQDHFPSAPC